MLTVNEIFHSIQGESTHAGRPCVFVRLTACDLRCSWCDTPYAFYEGRKMSLDDVMAAVEGYGCSLVELTGGEPLLQKDVYPLMERLLASGKTVLVETGGHLSLAGVPPAVHKIMDVKCPGSGESHRIDWSNLERLSPTDEVKFVSVIAPTTNTRETSCHGTSSLGRWAPCCSRPCTACSIHADSASGCWPIGFPCASSSRCTSTSGTRKRGECRTVPSAKCEVPSGVNSEEVAVVAMSRVGTDAHHWTLPTFHSTWHLALGT